MVVWSIEIPKQILAKPTSSRKQSVESSDQATPKAEHKPGLLRDVVERVAGTANAVMKIPANMISGTLVGAYEGMRKGASKDYKITPERAAAIQVGLNTVQGTIQAAVTGFAIGGPIGAATNMALDSVGAGTGIYFFVKNGSAKEMGKRLSQAIDKNVDAGEGALKGLLKGAVFGGGSAVKGAAATGYREGKGGASGLFEGVGAAAKEVKKAKSPGKGLFKSAVRSLMGVAGAVVSGPAGIAHALMGSKEKPPGRLVRTLIAAGSGAAVGAATGLIGGPVGAAVGAGAGLVAGLLGPARKEAFAQGVTGSVKEAKADDTDLGTEISNKNRNLVQAMIVGATSGARHGWDHAMPEQRDS